MYSPSRCALRQDVPSVKMYFPSRYAFQQLALALPLFPPGVNRKIASQHPDIAEKMTQIMKQAHVDPRRQIEPKKPKGKRFM